MADAVGGFLQPCSKFPLYMVSRLLLQALTKASSCPAASALKASFMETLAEMRQLRVGFMIASISFPVETVSLIEA